MGHGIPDMVRQMFVGTIVCVTTAATSQAGESLPPEQCGQCHQVEYDKWTHAKHRQIKVACNACHGQLHSGKIEGCRQCHGDKHGHIFEHWPAVQRFDPPNSNDYVCAVCHDPHHTDLTEHKQSCKKCHNDNLPRDLIMLHADLAEWVVPTENDGYVLRESTGAKLLDMGGTVLGFLGLPISIPVFLVGTVMLFPLGLGIAVISTSGDASVDDDTDATDQG